MAHDLIPDFSTTQLYRELDAVHDTVKETRDLVRAQNGRVRRLENKMTIVWFILTALGAVAVPVVVNAITDYLNP